MKYLTVLFFFVVGVMANASSTSTVVADNDQTNQQENRNIYAYSKSGAEQKFLENVKNKTVDRDVTIVVPHSSSKPLSVKIPTSQGIQTVHVEEEGVFPDEAISDEVIYMDYDKRWVQYNQWQYFKTDNEFDNKVFKVASLISNDKNATLRIGYDTKDKQYQKPIITIDVSGNIDGDSWHNFLCIDNCLNIDLNVDGKKYQKINMAYNGDKSLIARKPTVLLNYIKNGEIIKIRLRSVTGDYLIYEFEPEAILDLKKLKSL